ncbi:hypothetical protein G6021_03365, partial [Dietzia sp. CW19]|nr:hypothetical protein [Dietzia sp. CW19]
MRHLPRRRTWSIGALVAVVVVAAPIAVQAQPRDGAPAVDDSRATPAIVHESLED